MEDEETKPILLSPIEVRELEGMALALESIAKGIRDILARGQESEKETRLWPDISK
jgi:hypothetical protein